MVSYAVCNSILGFSKNGSRLKRKLMQKSQLLDPLQFDFACFFITLRQYSLKVGSYQVIIEIKIIATFIPMR